MKIDKSNIHLFVGLIIPLVALFTLEIFRRTPYAQQALSIIVGLYVVFALVFLLFFSLNQFLRLTKSIWISNINTALIISFGFLLVVLSANNDIMPSIGRWNLSMMGVGFAVVAFGWRFLPQRVEEQNKEIPQDLGARSSSISEKMVALNDEFNKIDRALSVFLEESKKLTERLSKLEKQN